MKIHSQKSDANTNTGETISIRVIYTTCNVNTGKGRDNFGVLLGGDVMKGKGSKKKRVSVLGRTLCKHSHECKKDPWS